MAIVTLGFSPRHLLLTLCSSPLSVTFNFSLWMAKVNRARTANIVGSRWIKQIQNSYCSRAGCNASCCVIYSVSMTLSF